jgi:hypothetical protein
MTTSKLPARPSLSRGRSSITTSRSPTFFLGHSADINTNWSSHEPASILHELVWHKNYEAMQFLIDRGIDMTILDFRWNATAQGWAYHAAKDEKMAQWLGEAQQRREQASN